MRISSLTPTTSPRILTQRNMLARMTTRNNTVTTPATDMMATRMALVTRRVVMMARIARATESDTQGQGRDTWSKMIADVEVAIHERETSGEIDAVGWGWIRWQSTIDRCSR